MQLSRPSRGLVCGLIAVTSPPALGFTGINDPCPLPTPFPPAGSGAGVLNNPGFENGFINGAASQWVAWKDPTYTNFVHQVGNDRQFAGNFSQRLELPQPPPDNVFQEAGIYQQIWVVPGASYTVAAKVYLSHPGTTNGQSLLASIGADPYGEPNGDGGGMVWDEESVQNEWRTTSVTLTAVFPVMTVSLKGTRKWPADGSGAKLWIDDVIITGPIPQGDPPGPGPDPIDPETLVPATSGANVVTNPSFESPFTDGVSAGWGKWSTVGTGRWKRSARIGVLGGGKYDCNGAAELIAMKTKCVLLLGPNTENIQNLATLGTATVFNQHAHMDDTIIVGRPFIDANIGDYYNNPVYWGRRLADQVKDLEREVPRVDCWQALNEPGWGPNWQSVLRFEYEFALRCHELGLKACSLNLATGNPGNVWKMVDENFNPSAGDLLAVADYLGHHVYGGPTDVFMVTNQDREPACKFALKPREFKDMYDRRGWRFPPVIATEGSTWAPWHGNWTPDRVTHDIIEMGKYMRADRFWAGYNNFVVGASCSWPTFEIVGQFLQSGKSMAEGIGDWNEANPADAMDGGYSQMFGAGHAHPKTLAQLTPAGLFDGGVNQVAGSLIPGSEHLLICWLKYEFRGKQPEQLEFYLGVDPTGQADNGNAPTIDWGIDQIAEKSPLHESFTHVWRTFTPTMTTASIWLRARHPTNDPSFMVYVDKVEVRQLTPPPGPTIQLSATELNVTGQFGINPATASFTVQSGGNDTINYIIGSSVGWVTPSPTTGISTGEADMIELSFDVTGLAGINHVGVIGVSSPEAVNSPAMLTVNLSLETIGPDFDVDGDVDQADFGVFQACLTGPGVPQNATHCLPARLDDDKDVDQDDFGLFQACMSGANVFPPPNCAD